MPNSRSPAPPPTIPPSRAAEALAPPIATLERRLILTGLVQRWAETVDRARAEARRRRAAPRALLARGRGRLRRRSRASHGRVRDRGHSLGPARRGRRDRLLGIFRADARLRPHRRRELAQDPGRAGRERPGPAPQRPDPRRSAPAPRGAAPSGPSSPRARPARCRPPPPFSPPSPACPTAPSSCRASTPISTSRAGRRSAGSRPRTAIRSRAPAGHAAPAPRGASAHAARRRARARLAARRGGGARAHGVGGAAAGRDHRRLGGHGRRRSAPTSRDAAAAGIKLVEAADEREEALAAAIALRETLDEPGRTAALVTPDRALAKRVAAELARWGIAVEDSAGVPLSETPAGVAARLAADAAALDFHPIRVLALLAHPRVCLGLPRAAVARAASALEIGVLRGPAPAPGLPRITASPRERARRHWPAHAAPAETPDRR